MLPKRITHCNCSKRAKSYPAHALYCPVAVEEARDKEWAKWILARRCGNCVCYIPYLEKEILKKLAGEA